MTGAAWVSVPANVPVVTAPTAGPQAVAAIGTGVDDGAVTIEGFQLVPKRLQVAATVGRDSLASFVGLEADVEMTLREALMSGLDRQCLYAENEGLLNTGAGADPAATNVVMTYDELLEDVYSAIDGRYAAQLTDLATLLGPATYRLAAKSYRGNSDNTTAIEALAKATAGVMTSAHVADQTAGNDQQAVVARGGAMHTGQAQRIWGGVEVVRDPYTLAPDGQIRISCVLMQDTAVLREAVYKRLSFHLA